MDFTELKRETLARHLRKHMQGEVRFDATACRLYSTDASIYQIEPLGVVIPRTVEDVLREGAKKARAEADITMDLVRRATGLRPA